MIEVKQLLTPADVERMLLSGELDWDDSFELVNGEIVPVAPVHSPHSRVCIRIIVALDPFARSIGAKLLDSSVGCIVGEHRQQLRAPDVSLISRERLSILTGGFVQGAPDLAVEVLSGGQHGEAYARPKLAEYFAAGSKVVWFADLRTQTVREYLSDQREYRLYRGDAAITLDAIAAGASFPVSSFFMD